MTLLADATDFFGTAALQDPYPLYDRMRGDAAVHRIGDSDFYAVCGWDAVVEAVNRVDDFSSNLTATMVYHEDGTVTPLDVKAGDRILFGKWSGTEVKLDGEDLIIMKEDDILGIVG